MTNPIINIIADKAAKRIANAIMSQAEPFLCVSEEIRRIAIMAKGDKGERELCGLGWTPLECVISEAIRDILTEQP